MQRMFADLVVSRETAAARSGLAFPASVLLHVIVAGTIVVVSLLTRGTLPIPEPPLLPIPGYVVVPPAGGSAVRPPAPPRSGHPAPRPAFAVAPEAAGPPLPEEPAVLLDSPPDTVGDAPCLTNCGHGSGGVPGGDPDASPGGGGPPPAPLAPVRTGGVISPPVKVHHVAPVYPEIARVARVQGDVVLDCTLSAEGRVADVRILSGPVLLQPAAADAVRQWVYRPTLLNGVAVPVIMTVTVRFTLASPR